MGLLTNPNTEHDRFKKVYLKWYAIPSIVLNIIGILWFAALNIYYAETYISENALLPAMVDREFSERNDMQRYLEGLKDEMDRYQNEMPTAWLQGQFRQLGLEVYLHNFTLNYPLSESTYYTGKNVYAILRSRRAAGTEALVLSAPFRSPIAVHPDTSPGISLMFALAKFFRGKPHWAKDIIFLISEHEQLGVKAWLKAYHGIGKSDGVLNAGVLHGQSGIIQAAINLEIHHPTIKWADLKIEGLNGQLPNLDLFNLAVRLCDRENVPVTFKNRFSRKHASPTLRNRYGEVSINWQHLYQHWAHHFKTTMAMVTSQATGTPTGNHGIFLQYGIDSLTLEGHQKNKQKSVPIYQVGRVVEGIFRSLNNLQESLHQSFFFYLLPSTEHYVSIGMYMPPLGLILLPLLLHIIKLQLETSTSIMDTDKPDEEISYTLWFSCIFTSHIFGFCMYNAPKYFVYVGNSLLEIGTENSLFYGIGSVFMLSLLTPLFIFRYGGRANETEWKVLKMFTLMEVTLLFATVSLANFSLAFIVSTITIPFLLFVGPTLFKLRRCVKSLFLLLISPMGLLLFSVAYDTLTTYPEENVGNKVNRIYAASKRVVLFAVTDQYIYGNWIYPVVTLAYFPVWIQLWCTQNAAIKVKQH